MKHSCPRCHKEAEVVSNENGICVECIGNVRKLMEDQRLANIAKFDKFIEDNKDRIVKCVKCSTKGKLKECHEKGWRKRANQFICEECFRKVNQKR